MISQFNFSLVLPDILANKTLGENALPGQLSFQSYVSKPFASAPCLGDLVLLFLFISFAYDLLFVYFITRDFSPDFALSFRSVQSQMDVSK